MKVIQLAPDIIYIEDAFPEYQEFIDALEASDSNPDIHSVIPAWVDWYDAAPTKKHDGNNVLWDENPYDYSKGTQKQFDWDLTLSDRNRQWPRETITASHSKAHELAAPIIEPLHKRYLESLDVWAEKTGNKKLDYVSRNYFIRKYKSGAMIAPHIDKNENNPMNTMDWSALVYLNDDYTGGDLIFNDLDISLKPKAGSIIFFPCMAMHQAGIVESGHKYFIFMMIHSEFGHSISLKEPYHEMNLAILKSRGITDHPLFDIDLEKL